MCVSVREDEGVGVVLRVALRVSESVGVMLGVPEPVGVSVREDEGVGVKLGVCVSVSVAVELCVCPKTTAPHTSITKSARIAHCQLSGQRCTNLPSCVNFKLCEWPLPLHHCHPFLYTSVNRSDRVSSWCHTISQMCHTISQMCHTISQMCHFFTDVKKCMTHFHTSVCSFSPSVPSRLDTF